MRSSSVIDNTIASVRFIANGNQVGTAATTIPSDRPAGLNIRAILDRVEPSVVSIEAGKADDPDNDGKNNLYEFAFDGNPLSGSEDAKVIGKIATIGADQVLTLTVPVRTGATFTTSGGDQLSGLIDAITYRIEGDSDLGTFANTISEVTGGDETAIQAGLPTLSTGWTYRTFRDAGTVLTAPKTFLRAKVSE